MAKKLQELRQAAGLSQSQLAEKAEMSIRSLQHYERGTIEFDNARIDTLLKVCIALNCRLEDIIENEKYLELLKRVPK